MRHEHALAALLLLALAAPTVLAASLPSLIGEELPAYKIRLLGPEDMDSLAAKLASIAGASGSPALAGETRYGGEDYRVYHVDAGNGTRLLIVVGSTGAFLVRPEPKVSTEPCNLTLDQWRTILAGLPNATVKSTSRPSEPASGGSGSAGSNGTVVRTVVTEVQAGELRAGKYRVAVDGIPLAVVYRVGCSGGAPVYIEGAAPVVESREIVTIDQGLADKIAELFSSGVGVSAEPESLEVEKILLAPDPDEGVLAPELAIKGPGGVALVMVLPGGEAKLLVAAGGLPGVPSGLDYRPEWDTIIDRALAGQDSPDDAGEDTGSWLNDTYLLVAIVFAALTAVLVVLLRKA